MKNRRRRHGVAGIGTEMTIVGTDPKYRRSETSTTMPEDIGPTVATPGVIVTGTADATSMQIVTETEIEDGTRRGLAATTMTNTTKIGADRSGTRPVTRRVEEVLAT